MSQTPNKSKKNWKAIALVILGTIVAVAIYGSAAGRIVAIAICILFISGLGYGTYKFFSKDVKWYLGVPLIAALLGFAFGAFNDAVKYGARIGGEFQATAWCLLFPILILGTALAFYWYQRNQTKVNEKINRKMGQASEELDKIMSKIDLS